MRRLPLTLEITHRPAPTNALQRTNSAAFWGPADASPRQSRHEILTRRRHRPVQALRRVVVWRVAADTNQYGEFTEDSICGTLIRGDRVRCGLPYRSRLCVPET